MGYVPFTPVLTKHFCKTTWTDLVVEERGDDQPGGEHEDGGEVVDD